MRRSFFALLLAAACFLCCGCRYSHEITEMAYTVALGLDKGEEGVKVSIQFARPLSISGGGGGGESSGVASGGGSESGEERETKAAKNKNTTMLTIDASDFYTALSIAENSLSKQINLSHTKLLLFSEKLAQDGVGDYVTMFMKNSQFSPNTSVAISLCSAEEYMRTANPSLEINPAKYYTLIFSQNNSDYLPAISLRDLYFDLSAPGQEPVLPAANISEQEEPEQIKSEAAQGDYEAGAVKKGGENRTDVSGMAVLREGRLSQVLTSHDARSYHMLMGRLKESYLTMESPTQEGKHITLRLTQERRPKRCVDELGDAPKLSARVGLSAEVVECPDSDIFSLGLDGLNEMASEKIEEQMSSFLELTRSYCRADVTGFGKLAKKKFRDYPTWVEYDWPARYEAAEFTVTAEVNISREGLVHVS